MKCLKPFKIHLKQMAVWKSTARFIDMLVGRRGGKTYIAVRKFIARVFNDYAIYQAHHEEQKIPMPLPVIINNRIEGEPFLIYWIVSPTNKLLKIVKRAFFEALEPKLIIDWNATSNELYLVGFIKIEFWTAERPDLLVGPGLNGVLVDEHARLKPLVWTDNLRPTLSDKNGWAIFCTTPKGRNHYYYDIRKFSLPGPDHDDDYEAFHWKTVDNTTRPALVLEVEKAKRTMPKAMFERNYEASLEAFEGQVWGEIDSTIHWADNIPDVEFADRLFSAQDWGYSNPGCLGVFLECGEQCYLIAGHHEAGIVVKADKDGDGKYMEQCWIQIYKDIEKWAMDKFGMEIETCSCDTENPEFITYYQDAGINAENANKEKDEGIQSVAVMLHPRPERGPRLMWWKNSPYAKHLQLIFEDCQGLHYKDGTEFVVKHKDHGADTVRYGIHTNIDNVLEPMIGAV